MRNTKNAGLQEFFAIIGFIIIFLLVVGALIGVELTIDKVWFTKSSDSLVRRCAFEKVDYYSFSSCVWYGRSE